MARDKFRATLFLFETLINIITIISSSSSTTTTTTTTTIYFRYKNDRYVAVLRTAKHLLSDQWIRSVSVWSLMMPRLKTTPCLWFRHRFTLTDRSCYGPWNSQCLASQITGNSTVQVYNKGNINASHNPSLGKSPVNGGSPHKGPVIWVIQFCRTVFGADHIATRICAPIQYKAHRCGILTMTRLSWANLIFIMGIPRILVRRSLYRDGTIGCWNARNAFNNVSETPVKFQSNKIWWLCLVPTSTTRFASEVGYRIAKI